MLILNPGGEEYAIPRRIFEKRYQFDSPMVRKFVRSNVFFLKPAETHLESLGFAKYQPNGEVLAIQVKDQDIRECFPRGSFMASWGEPMIVNVGDMLCMPLIDGVIQDEVFRIEESQFYKTYVPV